MTHKNRKKVNKFHFLRAGCSLFRAEGFSCSLDVLYGGIFFLVFGHQSPGSGSVSGFNESGSKTLDWRGRDEE